MLCRSLTQIPMWMVVPLPFIKVEMPEKEHIQEEDTRVSIGHSESQPIGDKIITQTFCVTMRNRKASSGMWERPDTGPWASVFLGASRLCWLEYDVLLLDINNLTGHEHQTRSLCDCDEVTDPFRILSGHLQKQGHCANPKSVKQ